MWLGLAVKQKIVLIWPAQLHKLAFYLLEWDRCLWRVMQGAPCLVLAHAVFLVVLGKWLSKESIHLYDECECQYSFEKAAGYSQATEIPSRNVSNFCILIILAVWMRTPPTWHSKQWTLPWGEILGYYSEAS